VGGHGPQLLGVEPVGKPLLHRLDGAQSRRLLVGPDVGRGYIIAPFLNSNKMIVVLMD
jgi:hypothetical protein